jgi:hypothetical protein
MPKDPGLSLGRPLSPMTLNGRDVTRGLTIRVRIPLTTRWRMQLGAMLVALAGSVIGCPTEVTVDKGSI